MNDLDVIKDLLSDPNNRIRLHDFVAQKAASVSSELHSDLFSLEGQPDNASFIARLEAYENVIQEMLSAELLLARWSLSQQIDIPGLPLRRIAGLITPAGGNPYLLEARWYPVFLLLYAACVGAVIGGNYKVIRNLTHASVPNAYGKPRRNLLLPAVFDAMTAIYDSFQLFPGTDRKSNPRSEHLHMIIKPLAEAALYADQDYEVAFDQAEMILSLEFLHIDHPEPVATDGRLWAPVGRFGWRRQQLQTFIDEARAQNGNWPPLQAGLFGGSATRFIELADGITHILKTWR